MSIKLLQDIFQKKGQDFIYNLLNLDCKVTEKLSGSKISFELDNNHFIFFKRDTTNPISKIDRLLSKYYDDAITYIESFNDDIKSKIPANQRFYFQYFPDKTPNGILYDSVAPPHKLILTHILVKDSFKSTEKIITDKEKLDEYATLFDVGKPPIIFTGKLSNKQKDQLMDYIRMDKEEALKKFKTTSFSLFLVSILNPDIKTKTFSSTEDRIEGLVFSFGDDGYQVLAKLVDPYFNEMKNSTNYPTEKNDMISIIFSDIIEFVEQNDFWKKIKLNDMGINERYIELISLMYNKFIDDFGDRYQDIDLNLPDYLKQSKFDINIDLIDDERTLLFVTKSIPWKEIYKMFLVLFRKKRNKTQEFLSPHLIKYQNNIVDQIYRKITNLEENNIEVFEEYIQEYSILNNTKDTHIYSIPDIPERLIEKNVLIEENDENLNSMRIISFWQKAFNSPKNEQVEQKGKGVNVVVGKFQPFNSGHMEACNELYDSNKKPIVLMQLHNGKKGESRPFSKELSEKMLNNIVNENSIFSECHIINNISENTINEKLGDNKYPVKIAGNENIVKYFKKSQQLNENSGKKIEFTELKKYIINEKQILNKNIVETIKNDDYMTFKKYVPECNQNYFIEMKNELK